MQSNDQERWDGKYRSELAHQLSDPDPLVMAALDELGAGAGRAALDLAAGTGRHSIELAQRAWNTSAWDVSGVGLAELDRRAAALGLPVNTKRVDVLAAPPTQAEFDLLLSTDFLDRDLWQNLGPWVRPGGHALLVTFNLDWPGPKPSARFRLRPGELASGLEGFETLWVREVDGRSAILAKRQGA